MIIGLLGFITAFVLLMKAGNQFWYSLGLSTVVYTLIIVLMAIIKWEK